MEFAAWNTLHDGSIKSIKGEPPGDLQITVGIEYLCQKLPTRSNRLVVHLQNCIKFEFQHFGQERPADRVPLGIEILSAEFDGQAVVICCPDGTLTAAYAGLHILTEEGHPIPQLELEMAAEQYWREWEQRNSPKN